MRTFEEIYGLREKFVNISDIDLLKLEQSKAEISKFDDILNITNKLFKIKSQDNWQYVDQDAENALEAVMGFDNWIQYLITSGNDPVGCFAARPTADKAEIEELCIIGFKENNITLVRNVFQLVKELQKNTKQYKTIQWSVDNNNPIKKSCDKIIVDGEGKKIEKDRSTQYILKS